MKKKYFKFYLIQTHNENTCKLEPNEAAKRNGQVDNSINMKLVAMLNEYIWANCHRTIAM